MFFKTSKPEFQTQKRPRHPGGIQHLHILASVEFIGSQRPFPVEGKGVENHVVSDPLVGIGLKFPIGFSTLAVGNNLYDNFRGLAVNSRHVGAVLLLPEIFGIFTIKADLHIGYQCRILRNKEEADVGKRNE